MAPINFFSKTDKRILWLIKFLVGLCLVSPLFVSGDLIFPYTLSKVFVFRIAVEIGAVLYFYLALKYQVLRPKINVLVWAVLIFLATWFLSAILGADWYLSFWGNLERMLGFWGLLHFVIFFLLLVFVFKTKEDWWGLIKISAIVGSLIAVLALVQKFWSLGLLLPQSDRVFSTIGNSDFLATYLIFNIFLVVYLLAQEFIGRRYWWASLWCFSLFCQLLAIFYTGTRGAWVGLAVGTIFCLALFSFFYPTKKNRRYFLASLSTILILGGLIFIFRDSSFFKESPAWQRLSSISLKDTTVQNRLILWQRSWAAWQERPIFGWGPENFEIAINKYFDPRLAPYEAWYDRAHNFVFDYGVATGGLGLASYLSLIIIAFFYLKKISNNSKQTFSVDRESVFRTVAVFIFSSLLVAYLVQNLFVFDVFVSYLMFFFILAFINFLYSAKRKEQQQFRAAPLGVAKKILVIALALLISSAVYFFNLKPIFASRLASQILSLPPDSQEQYSPLLDRALSWKSFSAPDIVYQVTLDYLAKISLNPQLTQNENFFILASKGLKINIERSPQQARNYVALAWLNLYFSDRHPERIDEAVEEGQIIKKLSPAKKDAYLILGAAYFFQGKNQDWQSQISEANKISPDLGSEVKSYLDNLIYSK